MLVQKNNLNKRTKVLLIILVGIIVIGGGYFGWQSILDNSNKSNGTITPGSKSIKLSSVQSSVDKKIFDNPQFLSLSGNKFNGFTDQYSGIAISNSKPVEINLSQVENPKTGGRLIISWQLPKYLNFDTVSIYRSLSSGYTGELIYSVKIKDLKPGKVMSYQDREVDNNKTYYYVIQSEIYDSDEILIAKNTGLQISGIPTDEIPPVSPDLVQVQGLADDNIEVSWFNPEESDLDQIRVYRSTKKGELGINIYGTESGQIGTVKEGSSMHYIIDTNVEDNTVYYYTVTSVDQSGNESSKDIFSASYKSYFYNPFDPIDF